MLSADTLCQIHLRMQEIKKRPEVFGGVAVVLVGNVIHLPTVNGRYIFEKPAWPDYKKVMSGKVCGTSSHRLK